MAPPVLELLDVGKSWGPREVLRDVAGTLGPGERLGLSGPNGSGKTTLLRCIGGTVTPTSGTIRVSGSPAGSMPARASTGAAIAQERAFYQRLSGFQNLMFYASIRCTSAAGARRTVETLIEELEIGPFARERVDRYSSGMCQQLGLARALLGDPPLLILDEPTRSLDEDAVTRLWAAIDRRDQSAVVIATHRKSDLDRCGLRIDLS